MTRGENQLLPQYLISQVIENAVRGYALEHGILHIQGKAIREKPEWLAAFDRMIEGMDRQEIARLAILSLDRTEKYFGKKLSTDRDTVRRFLSDDASDEDIRSSYRQIARIPDSNRPELADIVEKTITNISTENAHELSSQNEQETVHSEPLHITSHRTAKETRTSTQDQDVGRMSLLQRFLNWFKKLFNW